MASRGGRVLRACSISSLRKRFMASSSVSGISSATKRSMRERSPSGSIGASRRTSPVLRAASDWTTSTERPGELGQFLGARLATQLLSEDFRRLDDAREVGSAVEGDADGAALARERRQDGLADPPDGVRDELDALVRVELPGGGEQADVALADQVDEGESAVLVYFLATEMTKRRFRLTSSWSASGSPARIFRASSISSVPLRRG